MTTPSIESHIRSMPAVVQVFIDDKRERGNRCRLYTRNGVLDAWIWVNLPRDEPDDVHIGYVQYLPVKANGTETVLVGFNSSLDIVLSKTLPASLCPIPGVVKGIATLIDTIEVPPLREFALRAFLHAPVLEHFWRAPASLENHHAYPGGLAFHTLQVTAGAAAAPDLDILQRALAIVHGLTHDYGKPWLLVEDLRGNSGNRSHEAIGRTRLRRALDRLREQDETLADLVLELLGGPRAPRESQYPLAIRALVNAHDQLSCESERRPYDDVRAAYEPESF